MGKRERESSQVTSNSACVTLPSRQDCKETNLPWLNLHDLKARGKESRPTSNLFQMIVA